jgi:hypothetical protein
VSELRSLDQRSTDVRNALARNGDVWLATASTTGRPHLIAVSSWWDGHEIVVATVGTSRTARNLDATGVGRMAVGSCDDATMIDVNVMEAVAVDKAEPELRSGFAGAVGWNPSEEGPDWRFFRLRPSRMQAYRGYGELQGREVMRDGRWLADR